MYWRWQKHLFPMTHLILHKPSRSSVTQWYLRWVIHILGCLCFTVEDINKQVRSQMVSIYHPISNSTGCNSTGCFKDKNLLKEVKGVFQNFNNCEWIIFFWETNKLVLHIKISIRVNTNSTQTVDMITFISPYETIGD